MGDDGRETKTAPGGFCAGCRYRHGQITTLRRKGHRFLTLEVEAGNINVVWKNTHENFHPVLLNAKRLIITSHLERQDEIMLVIARRIENYPTHLPYLMIKSRDFHDRKYSP
jgi:hypothetical protein